MSRPSLDVRLGLAIAAMVVMWGSAFPAIASALPAFAPGPLALLRFLFASVTLGALSAARGLPRPARRDVPILVGLGLLGITIYHLSLNWGQQTVTAGAASLLIASAPMVTALLARLLLGETLGRWARVGILLGFGGIALITLGEGEAFRIEPGALIILLAAVSASLYSVLQKKHVSRYPPLAFTTYVVWAGTIPFLVFGPELVGSLQAAPASAVAAVAYLGAFPGGVAYVLWVYGLSRISASRLSSFLYLVPVLAIAIAWVWLREVPSWISLIGGMVTIGGVALANARRPQNARPSG
jgi:drug/metabolite transporter (DMT)-like permease